MKEISQAWFIPSVRRLALLFLAAVWLAPPATQAQFGTGTGAGTALLFDGVNDYARISNSASLNVFPLTIMGWFRNDDFNLDRGLVNKYAAGSLNGYQIYMDQGTLRAWYFRTNGSHVWDGDRGLNGGFLPFGWVHVAFAVDATGGKLYVNGTLRDSRAWVGTAGACTTTNEMRLGWYGNTVINNFWRGTMDEVSIWNVALSSNVIAGAMYRRLAPSENGLLAYWNFDEGVGNTTADLVPNRAGNNRGTLVGGPTWGPSGVLIGPEVTTRSVVRQTTTGATLGGDVIPRSRPTTAWFEWGTNTSFGNVTPAVSVGNGSNSVPVFADVTGLEPGRTYHYRVVATNVDGRANALPQSFTQVRFPAPSGVPPIRSTRYDGLFSQVQYEARPQWDQAVPMTIETWVYRSEGNRAETLVSHGPDSYRLSFAPRLRFYRGTNFAEIPNVIGARKWTHVAISYDGAVARFYLNGEFVAGRALGHNGAGKVRPLFLGYGGYSNFFPFDVLSGQLDEVRLWSVARSASEIRDGMYREVRGEPGLAAVFPWGGRVEEISGQVGFSGNVSEQIFGMVPRDLVVPRAPFQPSAEGNVNVDSEYLGAELLALRYPDDPTVSDGVAYFVHTADDLFVGVRGHRQGPDPSWHATNISLGLFIDPNHSRPLLAGPTQFMVRAQQVYEGRNVLLSGDDNGGYYFCTTFNPLSGFRPCVPTNLWQVGLRPCDGEFSSPCTEYRISRTLLGSFDEFDGVALGHFNFSPAGDEAFAPEDGFSGSPATWLTMSYGDGSASLPRVLLSGRVFAGLATPAPPRAGQRVTLLAGGAAYDQFTDVFGRFNFDVPMPTGQLVRVQVGFSSLNRYGQAIVSPSGYQPNFIGNEQVLYPALSPNIASPFRLANVDFFVQSPPPPAAILSATPTNPIVGVAVRQGDVGGPGEVVTIFGTNLHAEMEFYLAPLTGTFPNNPELWTLLPAAVVDRDPNGGWVKVQAPFVPEFVRQHTNGFFVRSLEARWRWVAHDSWFRPGRLDYSYTGTFTLRQASPYPLLHGFNFVNRAHDASLDEFLAGYGYSAYLCVDPFFDCDAHIPDPLYWALWYPVHKIIIDKSGGSCVGFAGTALELFNHLVPPQTFDPEALFANGIDGSGFPGHYDTSNTGGRYTRPPIPTDIWGRIRKNHGAQTSAEYLIHLISQLDVGVFSPEFGGDPVARLPELRAGTTAQAVCMVQGFDGGHCVSPYAVESNFGGDPNKTRIWIYDNNSPCPMGASPSHSCVTDQFIDIDHSANEYIFPGNNWDGTALFTVPRRLYTDTRTAPGVLDLATALATFIVVVAGGADAHVTTPAGGEWGWRGDGTFVNNLPGLKAVPILGSPTNLTRSIPLIVPFSNGIPTIEINTRDTNGHIFHVAAGGTMLQLESASDQPARRHRVSLGLQSNQLASFRFTPQVAHSNFTPRVGFVVHSNASATFQWLGLTGEGGKVQEFRAVKSRRAVEYCNETTRPTTHYLRIDAVDGRTTNNACAVFGPFNVPTGAVHCVVLQDWPRVKQLRSELDLNADGTPDQVTMVTGAEIDSDGDGMPDAWETLYQLDPETDDCDKDADDDGVSNLGEYLTDTHPRDPTSALRLTATMLPGNKVRLSWKAVPGRRYEIWYANGLEYVFQPLAGAGLPRTATATSEHFDDTLPAGGTQSRFYQLRLVP